MAVIFIKWFSDAKYYLSKGVQRAEREKKHEQSEMLWSTARVMEVSRLWTDLIHFYVKWRGQVVNYHLVSTVSC